MTKHNTKTRCRACPATSFCKDACYNRDFPDANCAHAVKYDKLNKRIASLKGQVEAVKFMSLKQRDTEPEKLWDEFVEAVKFMSLKQRGTELEKLWDEFAEKLWDEFADVPMNPDTKKTEDAFLHFPAGTPREDIWHWFDERYSKGVAALLYGRGEDNTSTIAALTYLNKLCCECDSELCAFADASGICRAPFITGAAPRIREDGCDDFCGVGNSFCAPSTKAENSEAGRYMVFMDSAYIRDAQIYCGDRDEDVNSEANEDSWRDSSGPILLIDKEVNSLDELRNTVKELYPEVAFDTLNVMRVSGKTVRL